jgi:hypothetical protein
MTDNSTLHPHRQNEDGSYESICSTCFATVARSMVEVGRSEDEAAHACSPSFLAGCGRFGPTETNGRTGPPFAV